MRQFLFTVALLAAACSSSSSSGNGSNITAARVAASQEATVNAGAIENGAAKQFQLLTDSSGTGAGPFVHAFCESSLSPVPPVTPSGKPYNATSSDWTAKTWSCLGFAPTGDLYCQYAFTSGGSGPDAQYTATVTCDPDGDGRLLRATLVGAGDATGNAHRVSFTITGDT